MTKKWTSEQKDAIDALDGNILVSAAAGSGKTAVLTQRVIKMISEGENPVSADKLLIVTFTRAAAKEMRERISGALSELIRKEPTNRKLINQQMLLASAKICTIDSFCLDLVKENFESLAFPPDFKIGDEGELALLGKEAMDMTMETLYKNDENGYFKSLNELLFSGRDDSKLCEAIEKLYDAAMSFPFPEKWLDGLCDSFEVNQGAKDSVYGKIILEHILSVISYLIDIINSMLLNIEGDEVFEKAYYDAVTSDKAQIESVKEKIEKGDTWNNIRQCISAYSSQRLGRVPAERKDEFIAMTLKESRETVKKEMKKLLEVMCCSEEEYADDMSFFSPLISTLIECAKLYSKNFELLKREKKTADFNDITHMAINLLVEEENGELKITQVANSLKESFEEILIDEYQDTNAAQDMIFTAISDNNLFRVGDVKQSIYRFRQANPDIFIALKDKYEVYSRQKNNYPAKIILGNNFRSRKGVTDIINFVFSQIMSRECGDIVYNDEEKLIATASYSEKNEADTELHLIETNDMDTFFGNVTNIAQAKHIARQIKTMIEEKYTIKDGDKERCVTYKDFAVLMRATGGGRGLEYADIFRSEGVPCFTEVPNKFLESKEVGLVLNILRVIDNPKQDIPLLSVMLSPVFGFTADDVARLRLSDKEGCLYACLIANEETPIVAKLLQTIRYWRSIGVCLPVRELINTIYTETALPSLFDAVDPSGTKRANLMLLGDYAAIYEELGYSGVSGFISFINKLSSKQRDISGSVLMANESNSVKIMTIHKSKGLEFPVCFVASCATQFNRMDETDNLVISQKHGLGIVRREIDTFRQYPTACHKAIKLSLRKDNMSEEMRVLYVAMTRAREKLILVCAKDNIASSCQRYASKIAAGKKALSAYSVSTALSYSEWIISTLIRHPDARQLREELGIDESIVLPCNVPLKVVLSEYNGEEAEDIDFKALGKVNDELLELIKQRSEYRYKYEALSGVMTKRAASETDKQFIDRDYFACGVPSFIGGDTYSGAARGIATHAFIQYADYQKAKISVKDEILRLCDKGVISQVQAKLINIRACESFFKSELLNRIMKSDMVMREKKFTIEVPISEIYPQLSDYTDEMMMIQGIADCAFLEDGKLVVVDYKTDALEKEEEFIEKYASQVLIYKKALTLCTGYEVKETLLYSLKLGKEISI